MKKIAAVLGLLMLLCSITACDSSMGVSGTQNYFLPNETNDISMVDGTGDSPNSNGMEEVDNMLFIREEETYMKDYVGDEKGTIIGIAFDKIKITNY